MCRGRRGRCASDVGRMAEKKSCFIERTRDGTAGFLTVIYDLPVRLISCMYFAGCLYARL